MKFWIGLGLVFAVCGFTNGYLDKTVLQCLEEKGYTNFVQLMRQSHLEQTLSGPGPLTVFAPNNLAFGLLSADLMASLSRNPLQLKTLLKYHVVNDYLIFPELKDKKYLLTSAGERIQLLSIGHSLILNNVTRVDSAPNNDIICNNGVIQPIDQVLIPPLYSSDNLMAVLLERDDLFQEFALSLLLNNLSMIVEKGEYTIFAPVDAAYAPILKYIIQPSSLSPERRREVMDEMFKYHIVPGARWKDMLKNGQTLYTLHGTPVNVTILSSGMLVNDAHVLHYDIPASNGVIHAIDHLLFPRDLLEQVMKEAALHTGTTYPPF